MSEISTFIMVYNAVPQVHGQNLSLVAFIRVQGLNKDNIGSRSWLAWKCISFLHSHSSHQTQETNQYIPV